MTRRDNSRSNPKIGEIYLVAFDGIGSEQHGIRPAMIFQNNLGNQHSPNLVVLPLTSAIKKKNQPTHVFISKEVGLKKDSMVLCENPVCISRQRMGEYLLTLPDEYLEKVTIANLLASSALAFLNPEVLMSVWKRASMLNK